MWRGVLLCSLLLLNHYRKFINSTITCQLRNTLYFLAGFASKLLWDEINGSLVNDPLVNDPCLEMPNANPESYLIPYFFE